MLSEKIDIHNTTRQVERLMQRIQASTMSIKQKKKITTFIEDLRIGKAGKKVRSHRISAYLQFLLKLHQYFKKDLDKLTEKEVKKFYIALTDNKITRENHKPYTPNTKGEFVKTLKRYYGWCHGRESEKYKQVVGWVKEERTITDKEVITLEQAEQIIAKEKNARDKALFALLFDSGGRIEEIFNLRLKDVTTHAKSSGDGKYYMINIKHSKTQPRTISVPLFTKYLSAWLEEHPTKNPDDVLFPLNYDNGRKIVKKMSRRILGHHITPHQLRHSSATYYIQKFGGQDIGNFYHRYGWKFGSKEANTYIQRNLLGGEISQEKITQIIDNTKIEKLEKENQEMQRKLAELKEGLNETIEYTKLFMQQVQEQRNKKLKDVKIIVRE